MSKDKQEVTDGTQTVDESHSDATPKRVQFDYLKSSCFRVVHADGVIGGLTPRLDIHMDFWSERFPIPKEVVHRVDADGALGDEIREERVIRKSIIREVEVGVTLDYENAQALRDWLSDRMAEYEKIIRERARQLEKES